MYRSSDDPDKAYTFEEIDARTMFPLTRGGLLLYLEAVKSGLVPRVSYTSTDGKDYFYWQEAERPQDG